MNRNLKVLGLAIVAVLAVSIVAAPAAPAEDLTSETSPVTLTGKQTGAGDVFTTTAGTVKCKEVKYTATSVATPTTAVNLTPNYPLKTVGGEQNCTGFGFPAEIQTNGCTYNFTIGAAKAGGVDIVCPEGKEITVIAVGASTTKCTVHVPAQTIASGVTYSETGSGTTREIDITANISSAVAYKHTIGSGLGACAAGAGNGSYTGTAQLTAENGAGAHTGIFLVPAAPAEDLTSETSPVTLTGKQTGAGDVFTTTAGTVKCKEVKYTATSVATPTTAVNLTPNYPLKTAGGEQNCTGFGFPAEIHTNECTYNFTIGAGKAGGVDILCPAGKEITITAISASTLKCVAHVPSQAIPSGVTYSETGSGTTREIEISANISSAVSYTHTPGTGVGSCVFGTGNGSYTGTAQLTAENGAGAHTGIYFKSTPPPSPDDLTSETSPVTLTGKQTGASDVLTTTAGGPSCKEIKYTATSVATPTTTVIVTPSYPLKTAGGEQNCTGSGFPWEIQTNGCTYQYTISAGTTGGVDILCPAGKEISMIMSASGTTKCTINVPAQNIASGITYSNAGAGATREVNVTANISNALTYKHTAGTGIGTCTTGHGVGSYAGAGVVTGENGAGTTHVGIFLS